jgi:uncharacterized protein involved in type VI secretion and phage assembly
MSGNGILVRSSYFDSSVRSRYPIEGTTSTTNLQFSRLGREAQRRHVSQLALDSQLSTLVAGSQMPPVWVGLLLHKKTRHDLKEYNSVILILATV